MSPGTTALAETWLTPRYAIGFDSGLGETFSGLRVTQIALGNIVSSQSFALCRQGMTLVLGGITQLLQEINGHFRN